MEPTGPTVPESSAHIDAKLAAIGAVSGIVAAMMMDTFSRLIQAYDEGGREAPDATVKVGTAAFDRSPARSQDARRSSGWAWRRTTPSARRSA